MLGVVIWTNIAEQKAIIWCEDQGDLAYLKNWPSVTQDETPFDRGDLIQFDLAEHRNMRLAQNPKRIAQHYCSDLRDVLETAQQVQTDITKPSRKGAEIIDFVDLKRYRNKAFTGATG